MFEARTAGRVRRFGRVTPFWRHFLEMFGVMVVGMVVGAGILVTALGTTWDRALIDYPTACLLVVAAGMSVPMGAWMVWRGMSRRNAVEMAAAMAVLVLPFLGLVWFDLVKSAPCGPYCLVAIAAMVALMRYRRGVYSMEMTQR
jgi:hypothetical protein